MSPDLSKRIARLAEDRERGASLILGDAIAILRDALAAGEAMVEVGRALCRAQPSMAPIWNAAAAGIAGASDRARFERFAADLLLTGSPSDRPLRVVTISYSGTVAHVLEALAARHPLTVACAEGRPALEGRQLAIRLAQAGVPVTCFADAALGEALDSADAVWVGADAVTADWILNKAGTRLLATAANDRGVPVHVLAGREKFVGAAIAARMSGTEGKPGEVWADPPAGVVIRNPYFEAVPLRLISAIVADVGRLGPDDVRELCRELRTSGSELLLP